MEKVWIATRNKELADKRKAFYRYKTEFKVNNFEPNTNFLESKNKPKAIKYVKSTTTNNKFGAKKTFTPKPKNDDCEFIDD